MAEKKDKIFYIVEASVLPEVILKVVEAKRLMESGKEKTVQSASQTAGISRSAFYKYQGSVFPFYENTRGKTLTMAIGLDNLPGILSNLLNCIAQFDTNILTINQNIPINNIANVTITIETGKKDVSDLVKSIESLIGVHGLKIIARE